MLWLITCPEPFRPKGPRHRETSRYTSSSESDGDSESGEGDEDEEEDEEESGGEGRTAKICDFRGDPNP